MKITGNPILDFKVEEESKRIKVKFNSVECTCRAVLQRCAPRNEWERKDPNINSLYAQADSIRIKLNAMRHKIYPSVSSTNASSITRDLNNMHNQLNQISSDIIRARKTQGHHI